PAMKGCPSERRGVRQASARDANLSRSPQRRSARYVTLSPATIWTRTTRVTASSGFSRMSSCSPAGSERPTIGVSPFRTPLTRTCAQGRTLILRVPIAREVEVDTPGERDAEALAALEDELLAASFDALADDDTRLFAWCRERALDEDALLSRIVRLSSSPLSPGAPGAPAVSLPPSDAGCVLETPAIGPLRA